MQTVDKAELLLLENPEGLHVVHDVKNPTLFKIITSEGKEYTNTKYTSKLKAEYMLFNILKKAFYSKKEDKKSNK